MNGVLEAEIFNRKSIQGLWSELFVLSQQHDTERWVLGWHEDPLGLHDFIVGASRIEVKSSSSQVRKHYFSHRQLSPPDGSVLWVASVMMEASRSGFSVFDLAASLRERVSIETKIILDEMLARILGVDYEKAGGREV